MSWARVLQPQPVPHLQAGNKTLCGRTQQLETDAGKDAPRKLAACQGAVQFAASHRAKCACFLCRRRSGRNGEVHGWGLSCSVFAILWTHIGVAQKKGLRRFESLVPSTKVESAPCPNSKAGECSDHDSGVLPARAKRLHAPGLVHWSWPIKRQQARLFLGGSLWLV